MSSRCEYCRSVHEGDALECRNCGAPATLEEAPDYRFCPYCHRRLVSLGSPTCNLCGRPLPANYVRAREAHLRRVTDVSSNKAAPNVHETDAMSFGEVDDASHSFLDGLLDATGIFRRDKD